MLSQYMVELGSKRSSIREMFEYGRQRAKKYGDESVYDFSLGNPNVPAPKIVDESIVDIINTLPTMKVHGYTSAPGLDETREAIIKNLNRRYNKDYDIGAVFVTHGAAMALTSTLKALTVDHNSEFIAFAPYFPEYSVFATIGGGKLCLVDPDIPNFQINFEHFESIINKNTQAVIVNSPNNPTGVIYSIETLTKLAQILNEKSKEYGHPIYLISDEPYRELVYDKVQIPFIPEIYKDTIICYSYSKSLSLPGERIGYALVSKEVADYEQLRFAVAGSARALGFVCASSLTQLVIARCENNEILPDLAPYEKNRRLLCDSLSKIGYTFINPQGAFYLFMQAPGGDAISFCNKAKEKGILTVPGDDFGCPGWLRMSYCVDYNMIERSIDEFRKLYEEVR